MTTPATVTVSGVLMLDETRPDAGATVTFVRSVFLRSNTGVVYEPFADRTVTGADGSFSIVLISNDDANLTPQGWTYDVVVKTGSGEVSPYRFTTVVSGTGPLLFGVLVPVSTPPVLGVYAPINHTHAIYATHDELAAAIAAVSGADLSNYVTTTALTAALAGYVTTGALAAYVTATSLTTTLGSYVTGTALTTALSGYATTTALTSGLSGKYSTAGGAITGDVSVSGYTAVHGLQVQGDLQVDGYASLQGLSLAGDLVVPNLHVTGSMVLDGGSTAPTAAPGTSTTQLATTAFAGAAATAAAAGKAATVHTHAESDVTSLVADLALKAPLLNPTFTGTVGGITKSMVGLGNVDNTADVAKTFAESQITNLTTDLAAKAPLASPALTGTPTTPTAVPGTNTTQVASTAYVVTAISGVGGGTGNVVGPASSTDNALVRWDTTTGKLVQDSLVQVTDSGSMVLTPQATLAYARGLLYYDSDNECLTFYNSDSSVSMQVGQEVWARVWNASGSTITNGSPVYVNGFDATSGLPTIALANGTGLASSQVLGLTTEAIVTGASGWVAVQGVVRGLNTSAITGATAGSAVYLGITAGALSNTPAASPNYRYQLGYVLALSTTVGAIYVRPGGQAFIGWSATVNQVLGMNSAANAQEYKTVQGTANQITLTHGAGSMTFSIPSNAALPGAPTTTTPATSDQTTKISTSIHTWSVVGDRLNYVTSGEEVMPREFVPGESSLISGTVHFSYFTARKTETITQIRTATGGTAAAGLTLARIGIYSTNGTTLTLVASTASDLTLWTATNTLYTKTLSASWSKVAGTRYAVAYLATGTTMPLVECVQVRPNSSRLAPFICGDLTGQTDIPATTQLESGLGNSFKRFQAIVIP